MQHSIPTLVARPLGAAVRSLLPTTTLRRATLAAAWLACIGGADALRAQDQLWAAQYGSTHWDEASAAAADGAGGVFAGGTTGEAFGGPHAGGTDAWLGRFDAAGNVGWLRQLGTIGTEGVAAVATDGAGGVYASGSTDGDLAGPAVGQGDAWVARYDGAGNQLWIRQFVIDSLSNPFTGDMATAVAPDGSGGVFVAGWTKNPFGDLSAGYNDVFIARFDAAGNQVWVRVFGTSAQDVLSCAAPDGAGGVFVGGYSGGSLGGPSAGIGDVWIARYDGGGNQAWIVQLGTDKHDSAAGLCPDGAGGLLVAGKTNGDLTGISANFGASDAWVARFSGAGNQIWIRQIGTSSVDVASFCAADDSGGCFIGGDTLGSLGGPHQGSVNDEDAWMAHYDPQGNQAWVKQVATDSYDLAFGAASDAAGGSYLFGHTGGMLGGVTTGAPNDVFLVRYGGECQAGTSYCSALTTSGGCVPFLESVGVPSLSAPGSFQVVANALQPGMFGLLFFGTTGANSAPFFGGTLCVASPLYRLQVANSGGSAACSGQLAYALSSLLAHPAGGPLLLSGTQVHSQAWFRDPPAAQSVGLTDGLEFTICP